MALPTAKHLAANGGEDAYYECKPRNANPYTKNTQLWQWWDYGWWEASQPDGKAAFSDEGGTMAFDWEIEFDRMEQQRDELQEQRDELLEALEFLTRYPEEEWAWQDAYAAIAKAKGGNDG